jgi:hypothetical protein
MMDCANYRRSMMVDPHDPDPALSAHCATCHDCTVFTQRLLAFESRLGRALGVSVPVQGESADKAAAARAAPDRGAWQDLGGFADHGRGADRTASVPRNGWAARKNWASRRGWLAMAASVLVAVVVAGGLWLSVPKSSLAADVVTHMAGEPQAWRRTDVPVPMPALADVLRNSRLRLGAGAGMVSYAASCEFRGHRVPHLVVQTESGPVTVMVLVHEHVHQSAQFDEQGYRGVIVPVPGHGSLAVLTHGPTTDMNTVEHIATRVLDSIVWTG